MLKEDNKKLKILQVVPSLSQANGVAAYISTYFQNMDKDNIDMTFLVLNNRDHGRYDEITKSGGTIVEIYREKNIFKYLKKIDKLFKNGNYDVVHCHVPNYGAIILHYAKKNKVPVRILHSHVNRSADRLLQKIRNDIISPIAVRKANVYFACSKAAGEFLFKKRNFVVVNNAIDIDKYRFDEKIRIQLREEMNLTDKFVVGEFGRLCPQKNQLFMLDIFNEILKYNKKAVLLLAGNGSLEENIKNKIKMLNIEENVLLLGSRNDLDKLYNVLDVFVLPSIYEGLGIVLIEAQANGLHCFTSLDVVPQTANVSSLIKYIELGNNAEEWANSIISIKEKREDVLDMISSFGFDIKKESKKLNELYKKYYKEFNKEL